MSAIVSGDVKEPNAKTVGDPKGVLIDSRVNPPFPLPLKTINAGKPESEMTISKWPSPSTSPMARSCGATNGPASGETMKESLRSTSGEMRTLSIVAVDRTPFGLPIKSNRSVARVPGATPVMFNVTFVPTTETPVALEHTVPEPKLMKAVELV